MARSGAAPHGPDGPVYPGICRGLVAEEARERVTAGESHALRLDMARAVAAAGPLDWHDRGRGKTTARPEIFGDVVLARKDTPTSYHLAVTVDDHIQGITLVTRGEDLFEATHVHRLLQALTRPEYAGVSPPPPVERRFGAAPRKAARQPLDPVPFGNAAARRKRSGRWPGSAIDPGAPYAVGRT